MKNDLKILFFEVTQKCNAHCDHCGSRCDIESEEGISKELFMSVLDDVKENIGTNLMLNITGGEPLLRKDLFEITAYANKLGFDWGMVSNGTLINEDVIKKMKKTGMKTITISIDGMRETHETFRHLPNSFNKIIQNIIDLKDANFLEHIQVTFIANKKNLHELPALWRMLDNLGIDSMRVSSIDPIGRANDNKDLFLDGKDFKYLLNFIENTNKLDRLPIVWSCSHYLGEKDDNLDRKFTCFTGKIVGSILYNGDIFACPNIPRIPSLIQGNIKTDKFSDVWKNKFKPFRDRKLNDKCNTCDKKDLCNGDSMHTWNFDENKPNFCYKEVLKDEDCTNDFSMKKLEEFLRNKYPNIKCNNLKLSKKNKTVVIEPNALSYIKTYFNFGKRNPSSMYEQQMALIGFKYKNYYVVKYAVPSILKNRTRNMGYVTDETINDALDEAEIINENFFISDDKDDLIYNKFELLGFIHSHPMDVDFDYSDGDIEFQKILVDRLGDSIEILVNPEKSLMKAIYGKNCDIANLKILSEK